MSDRHSGGFILELIMLEICPTPIRAIALPGFPRQSRLVAAFRRISFARDRASSTQKCDLGPLFRNQVCTKAKKEQPAWIRQRI
jgi:hypothetical protein